MNAISIGISKILDHEANCRQCPHGPVTALAALTALACPKIRQSVPISLSIIEPTGLNIKLQSRNTLWYSRTPV